MCIQRTKDDLCIRTSEVRRGAARLPRTCKERRARRYLDPTAGSTVVPFERACPRRALVDEAAKNVDGLSHSMPFERACPRRAGTFSFTAASNPELSQCPLNGRAHGGVLALLLESRAHVSFFTASGRYRGQLVSPESGNVFLRLAQHARYSDRAFRMDVALARANEALDEATLRGVEGAAAAVYFDAFGLMEKAPFVFDRRSKHPAHNAVNALLNLGYTLLTGASG